MKVIGLLGATLRKHKKRTVTLESFGYGFGMRWCVSFLPSEQNLFFKTAGRSEREQNHIARVSPQIG